MNTNERQKGGGGNDTPGMPWNQVNASTRRCRAFMCEQYGRYARK